MDMDSLTEKQIKNEVLFNKYVGRQKLKDYFDNDPELQQIVLDNDLDKKIVSEFVTFMYECDHANIEMLVGHMYNMFESIQECSDWIDRAIDLDLVDFNGKSFSAIWVIPKSMQKEFELYQYPLPMLVNPQILQKNTDCGYLTIDKQSVFCGDSFTPDDICLDVINIQNQIPLVLNTTVTNLTKNQWRSMNKIDPDSKKQKEKEEQFFNYDIRARNLVKEFAEIPFYLTNKIDKRGRMYDQGYFIHSQGTDWNKGAIEFFHKEIVED